MNIIIKLSDILDQRDSLKTNRIQFLNSKRNITMDGEFTKLLFVNENFAMDSLFIECPIQIQFDNNFYLKPDTNKKNGTLILCPANNFFIHKFTELEKQLLNYYKTYKLINKKSILLLNNHLLNGNIKLFATDQSQQDPKKTYVIKISGIWESYDSVGITYKILEFSEI
jgi:hypothetical protein